MKRLLVITLLFAAVWQLAAGGWIHAKAWLSEVLIADAWEATRSESDHVPPWDWADTWPVAKLSVPGLEIERYILAGASGRTLAFGPGWIENSARPGSAGKSIISGHRDTHFRFLQQLKKGDQLVIERPDRGLVHYAVLQQSVHHETETGVLLPDMRNQLLLITCYPFDALVPGGPLRYVVTAEEVVM
ncbi:MAG: class GN sortase [endosymbiont of Seepiophila jonesi]|uniref:Class GN sortase n=1 Tax=endosymbiont of Lamellibrachia luymesi TaxID=2200907 RepID=A0A370DC83_9GAMM|nr:MAG: class GN sortase [endosymbiont of Lamellibrachia luymesi]RDH92441.1 MAG: class GN sortase [endosymbiont of Seepiophila jonesi]